MGFFLYHRRKLDGDNTSDAGLINRVTIHPVFSNARTFDQSGLISITSSFVTYPTIVITDAVIKGFKRIFTAMVYFITFRKFLNLLKN
jgi:hypothetical protein